MVIGFVLRRQFQTPLGCWWLDTDGDRICFGQTIPNPLFGFLWLVFRWWWIDNRILWIGISHKAGPQGAVIVIVSPCFGISSSSSKKWCYGLVAPAEEAGAGGALGRNIPLHV